MRLDTVSCRLFGNQLAIAVTYCFSLLMNNPPKIIIFLWAHLET